MSSIRFIPLLVMLLVLLVPAPGVRAQTAVAAEFPVNILEPQRERDSAVARNAAGRTVIVWDDGGTIRARRFDAAGAPLDDGFIVDAAGARPDVAIGSDGRFIVSYVQPAGSSVAAVYRRYDADGMAIGPIGRVQASEPARRPVQTAIALDGQGRFAIATVMADPPRGISTGPFLLLPLGAGIIDLAYAPIQVSVSHFDAAGRLVNSATLSRANDLTFYIAA